jgi:hypothetical protein
MVSLCQKDDHPFSIRLDDLIETATPGALTIVAQGIIVMFPLVFLSQKNTNIGIQFQRNATLEGIIIGWIKPSSPVAGTPD